MFDTNSLEFILPLAVCPFLIAGFIGNVLVIRIVHKTREMHTTTNYLLANLAVSDVLTIFFLWPVFFTFFQLPHLDDGYAKFICKFSIAVSVAPTLVSSFTLTLLAVERYHALLKPFRTGLRLSQDNIKKAITVVWVSSALLCSPGLFLQEWSKTHFTCIPVHSEGRKIHSILNFTMSIYAPLAILLFCYGSLIKGLYFSNTICTSDTEEDRGAEKKKLVITFILATAGYVLGYGPTAVYQTVLISRENPQINSTDIKVLAASYFIYFCSLCLNPILYAFRSTNFKEGFKQIILCREAPGQNDIQL